MTEIYTVTCFFKTGGTPVQLQFTSGEAAKEVHNKLNASNFLALVEDQFGVTATINTGEASAIVLTHINRYLDGQREASLLQARAQAMTQRAAQNDPMLKVASMMPGAGLVGGGRQ